SGTKPPRTDATDGRLALSSARRDASAAAPAGSAFSRQTTTDPRPAVSAATAESAVRACEAPVRSVAGWRWSNRRQSHSCGLADPGDDPPGPRHVGAILV